MTKHCFLQAFGRDHDASRKGSAYAPMRPFETQVAQGMTVHVRDVEPSDRALFQLGFEELSDQSRYFRFLGAHGALSDEELTRFSMPGDEDHVAIGVGTEEDGSLEPVGVARSVRTEHAGPSAEIAITIIDKYQGMGVGTLLMACLAKRAADLGIETLTAYAHRENTQMLRLFEKFGGKIERDGQDEVEMSMPVFADPALYPDGAATQHMQRIVEMVGYASEVKSTSGPAKTEPEHRQKRAPKRFAI